jgi:NhaA family Na+:H+ antiporter
VIYLITASGLRCRSWIIGRNWLYHVYFYCIIYKGELEIQEEAKFAILVASAISGFMGYFLLKAISDKHNSLEHD